MEVELLTKNVLKDLKPSFRSILVCGDRNWSDREVIERVLLKELHVNQGDKIIQGSAPGADTLAFETAQKAGSMTKSYPADWGKYGKAAGPIRNRRMLEDNPEIDFVIAFHNDLDKSKGTKNMILQAQKRGLRVFLYENDL